MLIGIELTVLGYVMIDVFDAAQGLVIVVLGALVCLVGWLSGKEIT
jgi:hypothetical protein